MSTASEKAVMFRSGDATLIGVLHPADREPRSHGVLIVVGGPQYRVGSHRQFVIMARALAQSGYAVLRFDYRGMGDSDGAYAGFEHCEGDIRAAIDAFQLECPQLASVYLFGLCDGASAALMYAPSDARVGGVVLANPWHRTESTQAATYLRHYYWRRLLQASFWSKLLKGGMRIGHAMSSFAANVQQARNTGAGSARVSFIARMREAMSVFRGRTLLVLSGDDLTAREFVDAFDTDKSWLAARRRARLTRHEWPHADHTFSAGAAHREVIAGILEWLDSAAERGKEDAR